MMELERVDTVPSFERDNNIMFSPKLEHSFDDIQAKTKTSTLRNELTGSYEFDAARVVELDLYEDGEDEDEGEVMLLAMILLQLHGVKFPNGFPEHNKKKRQRTSPDQLAILEQIFQTDKMPSQQTRVQLADQLGMTSRRVQIWFQNKRAKVKRGVGKSSDGFQQAPDSPQLDIEEKDGSPSLSSSSSSCLSEPSSPIPDSSSPESSPPTTSMLSITPPSPNNAVVPSSPSLPQTPRLTPLSPASKLQFSLNSLAAKQQIMFSSEFSSMSSLLRPQGV